MTPPPSPAAPKIAPPTSLRFSAEVYTWFMHETGRTHAGRLDHMIDVAARAGFTGIEPIFTWMGGLSDPVRLAAALDRRGVKLSSLALALPWNDRTETADERRTADEAIALLRHFPDALLCTVQLPAGRHDLAERQRRLVQNVNAVSRRAADAGIACSYHPNSPHESIVRTADDYAAVLENLDARVTGWTPDVGHLVNGGMDPLATMQRYSSLINLVHFKDWDGAPEFCLMGRGKVDLAGIARWLQRRAYTGWIVCEDEGPEALTDPDGVTLHDGRWVSDTLRAQLTVTPPPS